MALHCVKQLKKFCSNHPIYVVQNGKSPEKKRLFTSFLDDDVTELQYPEEAPGEHFHVIEHVLQNALPHEDGIWFLDHDAFLLEDAGHFFSEIDRTVEKSDICMFTPDQHPLTIPAFWLAPKRFPEDCPSLAPYPHKVSEASRRPDMFEKKKSLDTPQHDTLVLAQQHLAKKGLAGLFPVLFFPEHHHLGGLHAFLRSSEDLLQQAHQDEEYREYMVARANDLKDFFSSCPQEWLVPEERAIVEKIDHILSSV